MTLPATEGMPPTCGAVEIISEIGMIMMTPTIILMTVMTTITTYMRNNTDDITCHSGHGKSPMCGGGGDLGDGNGQDDASTGANPQQVFTHQQ